MKTAKYIATFLTALFIGIVLIERVPGVLVDTDVQYEWLMFGLFKIALLDDITHGLSGLAGIIALFSGYRWTVKYLIIIGGYYALDALFFIVNGFLTGQGVVDNFLLNAPHIAITDAQFHRAYPGAVDFFALKNHYDPLNKFTNKFWDKYYSKEKLEHYQAEKKHLGLRPTYTRKAYEKVMASP